MGVGSFHLILKGHAKIAEEFYLRLSFLSASSESDMKKQVKFIKERRMVWLEHLKTQNFATHSTEPAVHILSEQEINKTNDGLVSQPKRKKRLNRYWQAKTRSDKKHIAVYGELVRAAEADVHDHLDDLNLRSDAGRLGFTKTLNQVASQLRRYIDFVGRHLQVYKWTCFTFDLKAANALVVKGKAVLADLDAEEDNCFDEFSNLPFCVLFTIEDREVLAFAAFILLIGNSIRGLGHPRPRQHREKKQASSIHEHKDCPEYLFAEHLHNTLKTWKSKHNDYGLKIKALFDIMTSTPFWSKSTLYLTHYLHLPSDSPGYKEAWQKTTQEMPGYKELKLIRREKRILDKKRWLLLLFLNIFKCSLCARPPRWMFDDLVVPLWSELQIAENGWFEKNSLNFELSLDFLKKPTLVKVPKFSLSKKPGALAFLSS